MDQEQRIQKAIQALETDSMSSTRQAAKELDAPLKEVSLVSA
jgi:hypothetical protein